MEKRVTILIAVTAYLIARHLVNANKRSIRSVLAPEETITKYEAVSPVIIYQSEETAHGYPNTLWIKFDMSGKTFELHLTMNKNLLSPKYTEVFIENGKTVINKDRKNCFYHGTVMGFAEWSAVVSTCEGLRGTFGNHEDLNSLYHIEPLESTSNEIEQTHIVFDSSELSVEKRNGTCWCNGSHGAVSQQNVTMTVDRVRRRSGTRTVEWFICNDNRQFIAQGRNRRQTEMRSIDIANIVDHLYRKIDIKVSLVGVETWSQQNQIRVTSSPSILLSNFQSYLNQRRRAQHFDSAMLITGINLNGGTLGIAPLGTMCMGAHSSGITQDAGSSVEHAASIAAHEMGHIFNMEHDNGRGCRCAGTNNHCIMWATVGWLPAVEWSSCSVRDLKAGYARNLDRCLFNEATMMIVGESECGNGIREGDEMCDCGTPVMCDDPCCNPNTCQLINGAVCSSREACCSSCQFKASGMECRSATNECDIPEYCAGNSGECPTDQYRQNGADCASGQAYCFSGICKDLNALCNDIFAPKNGIISSVGPQQCFNFNTDGTEFGNCGHNTRAYIPCDTDNVRCGQLHCQNSGNFHLPVGTGVTVLTKSAFVSGHGIIQCRSFTTRPGADIMLGLVPEGAKCGANRVCKDHECVRRQLTACPSANRWECSGNGVCNDLNQCTCNPGFTGDMCNLRMRA